LQGGGHIFGMEAIVGAEEDDGQRPPRHSLVEVREQANFAETVGQRDEEVEEVLKIE
jgi:hypothetical protein